MKKTRFTETQIVSILKKQELGIKVAATWWSHGGVFMITSEIESVILKNGARIT